MLQTFLESPIIRLLAIQEPRHNDISRVKYMMREEPGKLEHQKNHRKEYQIFPSPAKHKHKQTLLYSSNDKQHNLSRYRQNF